MIYQLIITATPFLHTFHRALSILSLRHPPGLLITTSGISKFFSNGLDLDHVHSTHLNSFYTTALFPVFRALLSFPMPTLALLNGHTFAGGLLLAMHHDYRLMNPAKGFAALNEIDFGMLIETPLLSAVREKTSAATFRALILEGRRFPAKAAVEAGFVDEVGGLEEAVKYAVERKLWEKGKSGVFARMREEMYRQSVDALSDYTATKMWREGVEGEKVREGREAEEWVRRWESEGKAKL